MKNRACLHRVENCFVRVGDHLYRVGECLYRVEEFFIVLETVFKTAFNVLLIVFIGLETVFIVLETVFIVLGILNQTKTFKPLSRDLSLFYLLPIFEHQLQRNKHKVRKQDRLRGLDARRCSR